MCPFFFLGHIWRSKLQQNIKKILFGVIGIISLFLCGFFQTRVTDVISKAFYNDITGIATIVFSIAKIFVFLSPFFSCVLVSAVTCVFYELFFLVDIDKLTVYIISACGFIIHIFIFTIINKELHVLENDILSLTVLSSNINTYPTFIKIKKIQAIASGLHYIYMAITVSIIYRDTVWTTLKYSIVLASIFCMQFFVLNRFV